MFFPALERIMPAELLEQPAIGIIPLFPLAFRFDRYGPGYEKARLFVHNLADF